MAGKSSRAKNRGKTSNSKPLDSALPRKDSADPAEVANGSVDGRGDGSAPFVHANGSVEEPTGAPTKQGEGEMLLFPVAVKSQTGEKLELQLSPGDSVMDVRQFLLDAPETCFFTCYDLVLHTNDGATHPLEDYNELSEVADITTGACHIEMVSALYDERSIRSHVRRARDLLSLSTHHTSLSTLLALQHESSQKKDSVKGDVPELEGLGFMDDIAGSLGCLMSASRKDIICVDSIVFSSLNPPPSYRRLVGDLIYIDVVTLEGSKYCITGSTKNFYVNSSSGTTLDPKPHKQHPEATTLIGLLQKISAKFKKGFREILDWKSSAHQFENVQTLLPPNTWLGQHPVPDHKRDAARAEDAYSLSYGTELIGMQRDWNEELQSCREFPHSTPQESILRDRALYKVSCDFVDAAIKGAVGVINKCIPPINPTDPECFHMYVHNNIFFSFAVDAELGLVSNTHGSPKVSEAHHNLLDEAPRSQISGSGDIITCSHNSSNGAVHDHVDACCDVAAEAQSADGEQATYASANNDLKGTKAYQEADVPGLYNLAMAIVDYRGYRVVAQSIIPGILQGDKSDSLLYGSVDNGKKISWNEAFHSKVLEAAKCLHIKEHTVLDGSGNAVKLAAPVECKGIVGSDDRHYLLDLMRITPRDVNFDGPGSKFCVLRPELVSSFCRVGAEGRSKSSSKTHDQVPETSEVIPGQPTAVEEVAKNISCHDVNKPNGSDMVIDERATNAEACSSPNGGSSEELLLNPNVFTEFKVAETNEEIAADEENVKKACSYLVDVVVPKFVQDLCSLEVSPMDGNTLTDALHAHGINVRYLGKIATMTKHLPHLWDICTVEIIVRSAKHTLKDVLREAQDHDVGPAISHFLNCLFGNVTSGASKSVGNSSKMKTQKKEQSSHQSSRKSRKANPGAKANQPGYLLHTSTGIWSQIQEFAKYKYRFELPNDAKVSVRKVSALRNLCLKVGISVAGRKYDFGAALPFEPSDILNLQPIVKHSVPVSSEAKGLIEAGKTRLAEGLLNEAYKLFSEAFSLLQQITGPMHREVASCCRYLAMVLYHAGDMAGAVTQQHKELIINERCLGLDHPDTAHSYGNMALFYHGLNQTELALRHMSRTLLLLSLSSGADHPDVAATFINIAMMYQDIGKMNTALRYLQEALKKNERLLGQDHIQTAVCYHALAIAFNCMGAYKFSLQHEKKTHDIFVKQLGEDDSRTRDSESWIKTFQMRDQQVNAEKRKAHAVNAASAQKAIDILKAHPDLVQAFQAAAAGSGSSSSALGIGEALPRGRGVDERAARAVAEARKKAAAKGLLVRPHGVSAQAMPQLAQLLNIINSSATPDSLTGNEPNQENAVESTPENDSNLGTVVENMSAEADKDQAAPVGLGAGLSSLQSKKQKQKLRSSA